MTPRELWESYKTLLFDDPDLGVRLDLSRMGVSARDLEAALPEAFRAIGRARTRRTCPNCGFPR